MSEQKNFLYYGDNLDVLRRYVADESVDLVYLDPPFNSNATYNVLFAEQDGTRAAAQVKAFGDTWRWDQAAADAYREAVEGGGDVSRALQAFRTFLGDSNMLAYLAMMAPRLVELRRVLKPTGSIYLHCDPTASHYLKMLMDAVFGAKRFRNEIIWWYYDKFPTGGNVLDRQHDVILQYSKGPKPIVNLVMESRVEPGRPTEVRIKIDGKMRRIRDPETGKTRFVEGTKEKKISDVWRMPLINSMSKERLGYPTQKPEALLERVIKASSNEGDLVLDPFCGCGTTIAVAQRIKRRWIGIDITHLAVGLIKHRLKNSFGENIEAIYDTIGEPTTLDGAEALAEEDPYQFQWWALGLAGARPNEQKKKGADKGIDGRLYFHDEGMNGKTKQVVLSVKAGKTGVAHVRDLGHVVERENAQIGVLIAMREPTLPMRAEAAGAGHYESPWGTAHPRLQILTIEELLGGKRIDMPPIRQTSTTFKKARRHEGPKKLPSPPLPYGDGPEA